MNDALLDLLNKRRDRAIAIILRCKEQEVDPFLPMDQGLKLRKVVLDQLNGFADLATDVLGSLADNSGVALNELWLDKLEEMYDAVMKIDERI